ncbi:MULTISPECIES: mersacidin/lichenicidin family type 2 lantibiotic [Actinoalloteichus]|uniref:Type 2 lantibiotic, mersacidin/lichenicidin family n=1 Tax=Actinoalloteichus fjordicus TaxID=1612552 RepID=A0AAC9L9R7_9PSEU|nr:MULTISPECIES: mersacidin/lichenicidin family type 2 lantibiotic [Actinoalloteichus]APU13953.1 type 2 lantibiotic, mersacidin/lichenicidin family [Actinoalloteichus fjordicus]APU19899.1 type 2 lantibiotic, mersacidin/lichenicidin family [Actinoalloteichus sp. GBA129-24]
MDIVRSWKDPEFRASFPSAAHPAGPAELTPLELGDASQAAGGRTENLATFGCCFSPQTFTYTSPILCSVTLSVC